MQRLLLVHGLKRSGNHGIIQWLEAHDRFLFFNNIIPIAPILRGEKAFPPQRDFRTWLEEQCPERSDLEASPVIASLEDHELQLRPFTGLPNDTQNVLILRDPFNLLASRIRKASSRAHNPAYTAQPGPAMDRVLNRWKEHAREFLGQTDHLENKICVYFNAWFSNQTYRAGISRQLGFELTDRGFSKVSKFGGGSSFDGTQIESNQKIDVLNRQQYLDDSERQVLESVVEDEELQELAQQVAAISETVV